MPSFSSLFVCMLAASSIFAAPVSEVILQERGHKKTAVCGVSFDAKKLEDKAPLDSVYTLEDKSSIIKETKKKDEVKKGWEIDHVVELQMVQKVADDSKLCDVLEALHKVDKDKSPEKVLESAKDSFNGTPNVFFLSKKVLERKQTVTQNVLKSKKQSDKDMDKAVGEYLKQVGSSGTSVATALDKNFSDVINTAKDAVKNAPKDKKSKADKLQKALDAYKSSSTVTDMWSKELKAF